MARTNEIGVRVESGKYTSQEIFLATSILQNLVQITELWDDTACSSPPQVAVESVTIARSHYRKDPKYGEFTGLLGAYLESVSEESKSAAIEVAAQISEYTRKMNVLELREPLPWYVTLLLLVLMACSLAVIPLIAVRKGCCSKTDVAALVLAAVTFAASLILLPVLWWALKASTIRVMTTVGKSAATACMFSGGAEVHNKNPLSEGSEDADPMEVEQRMEGFLHDANTVMRHRKAVDLLLTEATEDDGNVVLRSRALRPASVSLSAIFRHTIIIMTNLRGVVVMWSEGAVSNCGFSARDAEGSNITTLLSGEKSIETYTTMAEGAEKNVDLSERILTLAHMTLGSISVSSTVVLCRDTETNEKIGFALIGSVRSDELSQTQSLFHHFFVTELQQLNLKDNQLRQIVDCLQWKNLRALSAVSRDWGGAHVRVLLSEVIKGRDQRVDVKVDPKVSELPPILGDTAGVIAVLNRACDLFPGKVRIRIGQKGLTGAIFQLIVTFEAENAAMSRGSLAQIVRSVNDLGGLVVESPGTLKLQLPFIMKDNGIQVLRPQDAAEERATGRDPLIILLLEKNAVYRHNISSAIWSSGHSLRVVDNVRKALDAVEKATDLSCAIVDADTKGSDRVVEALLKKSIFTIETTEASDGVEKHGDVLVKKPITPEVLWAELDEAVKRTMEAKRMDEDKARKRETFTKVRNSPWICGRELGRGAFATVYEATSTLTNGKMAVKMIRVDSFEDRIDEFLNEIEILSNLTHPNIIHYFYCERGEGTVNLFMALADQGTVADLLRKCPRLPENYVATIAKQLLQAVDYLHESNITHRDIKPGNMLISQGKMMLSDFGTATTKAGEGMVGTLQYMAPEVVDGKASGRESDIWSIGCVVCECLKIRRPGNNTLGYNAPEEYPSYVSAEAVAFIKACMRTVPSERATAGTLLLHDFILHLGEEVSNLGEPPGAPLEEAKPREEERSDGGNGSEKETVEESGSSLSGSWPVD